MPSAEKQKGNRNNVLRSLSDFLGGISRYERPAEGPAKMIPQNKRLIPQVKKAVPDSELDKKFGPTSNGKGVGG